MQTEALVQQANILMEALPYIQRLSGKTVVIKYCLLYTSRCV